MVSAPCAAVAARLRATLCRRELNVWCYDQLYDAMATIIPQTCAFAVLAAPSGAAVYPTGKHKAAAAFQRGVAASIEKTGVGAGGGRLRGLTNPLPKI